MKNLAQSLKNRLYYSLESIKNRYPCKINQIKNQHISDKSTQITYQIVNKLNIREIELQDLVDDPLLIEKFHPTECIKIGFLCAVDILFKKSAHLDDAKIKSKDILKNMFDIQGESHAE